MASPSGRGASHQRLVLATFPGQSRRGGGKRHDTYSLALGGLVSQVAGRDDVPVVKTDGNTALGDLDCGHPWTMESPAGVGALKAAAGLKLERGDPRCIGRFGACPLGSPDSAREILLIKHSACKAIYLRAYGAADELASSPISTFI